MAVDALVLNGISVLGLVPGTAQVLLAPDGDMGAVDPDTATITSLLLDGDVQTGDRTGNRTVTLPFLVIGTSRASLQQTMDTFLQAVTAQSWLMQWTPSGCPGTVFTCYKAGIDRAWSLRGGQSNVAQVTITFQMRPFGQSTTPQVISVAASTQIDGMNTGTFVTGTLDTTVKYEGAGSVKAAVTSLGGGHYAFKADRTITSANLTVYGSLSARMRINFAGAGTYTSQIILQLTSASGTAGYTSTTTFAINPGDTSWKIPYFDLTSPPTSTTGTFNLAAVTEWQFSGLAAISATSTPTVNFDDLRGYAAGTVATTTTEGTVYTIPALIGSARTPVAIEIDRSGSTFTNMLMHSPPSDQDPDLTILAALTAGAATIPAANANYDGTYSLCVLFGASATGSTSRVVTATIQQKQGVTVYTTQTVSLTVIGTQTITALGNITLPLLATPDQNVSVSFVITITSTNGTDTFTDVALCDTEGQTILIQTLPAAIESLYVDAPDPLSSAGPIYASLSTDRTGALFAGNWATVRTDPIQLEPAGVNKLLVASTAGAPNATFTYTPSWLDEACA